MRVRGGYNYKHNTQHTHIWLGGGVRFPSVLGVAVTLLCFFPYPCGWRGAVKPDSANSPRTGNPQVRHDSRAPGPC